MTELSIAAEAPTADNLHDSLADLGDGLYFPAWANEADAYLSRFRQDAKLQELTEESFSSALGLDYANPTEAIELWHQGRAAYDWILNCTSITINWPPWSHLKPYINLWKNTSPTSRISLLGSMARTPIRNIPFILWVYRQKVIFWVSKPVPSGHKP